jgi:hypothetical protein
VADVEGALVRPPFGLPRAIIPILVTAFLELRSDEVGIFQDGTYQPVLSPEVIERMIKIPERFQVRDFQLAGDSSGTVLETVRRHLGVTGPNLRSRRNASVLSVAAPLLATVRGLPQYTFSTKRLSRTAIEVRDRLLEARKPDDLLFRELPVACGLSPESDLSDPAVADDFGTRLAGGVRELRGAYRRMLLRLADALVGTLGSPSGEGMRPDLERRANDLLERELESRLQATAVALATGSLEDEEWLTTVGLAVSGRSPASWTDADEDRFYPELSRIALMFNGAEALAFSVGSRTGPKTAKLVTVTSGDGRQISRVLASQGAPDEDDLRHMLAAVRGDTVADERAVRVTLALLDHLVARTGTGVRQEGDDR